MITIIINAALALIGMSIVYWIIQKLAEWWDSNHVYKWEKRSSAEMEKHKEEAIAGIRKRYPDV